MGISLDMSIAFTMARLVLQILIDVHLLVVPNTRQNIVCRLVATKRSKLLVN